MLPPQGPVHSPSSWGQHVLSHHVRLWTRDRRGGSPDSHGGGTGGRGLASFPAAQLRWGVTPSPLIPAPTTPGGVKSAPQPPPRLTQARPQDKPAQAGQLPVPKVPVLAWVGVTQVLSRSSHTGKAPGTAEPRGESGRGRTWALPLPTRFCKMGHESHMAGGRATRRAEVTEVGTGASAPDGIGHGDLGAMTGHGTAAGNVPTRW